MRPPRILLLPILLIAVLLAAASPALAQKQGKSYPMGALLDPSTDKWFQEQHCRTPEVVEAIKVVKHVIESDQENMERWKTVFTDASLQGDKVEAGDAKAMIDRFRRVISAEETRLRA